jgi:glycosyltransferase involved in cell wall biosynthesis
VNASIIIPAYNEEGTIGRTVAELKKLGPDYQIIVVDDGSRDATAARAREAGAEVVVHPYNKGYGAALKKGVMAASCDNIITFDADAQYDARDVPRLFERISHSDMVVADRSGSKAPCVHRIPGKWILNAFAGFLIGHRIPDLNSGFRCFRKKDASLFFHILPNGFSFSTTITLAYFKEGLSVAFVPCEVRPREGGKSEVRYLKDGARTLLLIARITALFNPLKIFAPVGGLLIAVGGVYALYSIMTIVHIPSGAVLSILAGVTILFFGILADQIACIRRQIR